MIARAKVAKPKRSRNAEDTRDKILRAARSEFASHGFAGARIERIVLAAETNPRMLYHYFGDKSGLYVAVLEDAIGNLRREEMKIDVEHLAPIAGLMQLFEFMNTHFESDLPLVRLLRNENLQQARYLKTSRRIREMSSPVLALIDGLLARGAAEGSVRAGVDALQLYVMMVALNQFPLSNVHTLSVIFDQNLSKLAWRAARHAAAREMIRAYLRPDLG
ncbi:MAG: TetR/AcrR family transcriptional regulator [Bradyrhizobium sp.]|nr:MAG: TetR/AcrR family transcriptional regulator [Bradyrhizobium sp.]